MVHRIYLRSTSKDDIVSINRTRALIQQRLGLTVLELIVSMGVLAMIIAMVLPALQTAREAARNVQCCHQLRQVGLAIHGYHNARSAFPVGWRCDATDTTAIGWATFLLPYLEHEVLFHQIHCERSLIIAASKYSSTSPAVFLCPSDVSNPTFDLYEQSEPHGIFGQYSQRVLMKLPRANYIGVFGISYPDDVDGSLGEGVFIKDHAFRFADIKRGLSNVTVVGERTARKLPATWLGIALLGEDAGGRIAGNSYLGPNRPDADECEFDSRHPGHVNFVFGDGHVQGIVDDIEGSIYREMAQR